MPPIRQTSVQPGVTHFFRPLAVTIDDLFRLRCSAYDGDPIFNPDELRVQRALPVDEPIVVALIDFLRVRGFLCDGRTPGDAVVIHSFAGCAQQPLHTDYHPDVVRAALVKPLGVVAALQDDTRLVLDNGRYVAMRAGDVVVFEGGVVHAGAAYASENTRVHIYVDSREVVREPNSTYPIVDDNVEA